MDVGVPREGASDGDSEIKLYAIKVVTVTQGLLSSRNPYCFALGSVQLRFFSQSKLQCKNTYKDWKLAREPRRNQKAYDAWAP